MCTNDKGKQINKQQGVACAGAQMQGAVWLLCNLWSPLCDVSEYTEGLWRCLEKHGVQYARSYSDITPLLRRSPLSWVTHGVGVGGWQWWKSQMMSGALARWLARSHSLLEFSQPLNFTR